MFKVKLFFNMRTTVLIQLKKLGAKTPSKLWHKFIWKCAASGECVPETRWEACVSRQIRVAFLATKTLCLINTCVFISFLFCFFFMSVGLHIITFWQLTSTGHNNGFLSLHSGRTKVFGHSNHLRYIESRISLNFPRRRFRTDTHPFCTAHCCVQVKTGSCSNRMSLTAHPGHEQAFSLV